ncbi:hypothetical protein N9F34_02775 [Alphaproteobacteria bacterium]|nr:hypothetical protein [Alphaproteobacteria bacterium]
MGGDQRRRWPQGEINGKLLVELICGVDSELLQIMMLSLPNAVLPTDPILRSAVDRKSRNSPRLGPESAEAGNIGT